MNILDENISDRQRQRLERSGVHVRQIGQEIGRAGMHDDEIVTLLRSLRRVTLFTRDRDFANPRLSHRAYCLVRLDCDHEESADLVRSVLHHPELKTQELRMGSIVRATSTGIWIWRRNVAVQRFGWPER